MGLTVRRSTFVTLGLVAFGTILLTFIVRGTTRLVIGDRLSMLLAAPFATISVILLAVLVLVAGSDLLGIRRMEDDLEG